MKKIIDFFYNNEFVIFCLIVFLNAIYVFSFNIYHTLDGPGHLHNSNVLINILSGNELINGYYEINPILVGNWTGNAVLTIFNFLFPASTALAFFQFTYFAGMAFSYRHLVKSISGTFKPIHYIMFPFFDNSCLGLGLYNFSTSLIIFFILLGFMINNYERMTIGKWTKFSILLVLLYFSHFLTFVLFGICLIVFFIYHEYLKTKQSKNINWKSILTQSASIILVSLPSMILALLYAISVFSTVESASRDEPEQISLLENLYMVRPLILFHIENDGSKNMVLFTGIILLCIFIAAQYIFKKNQENTYQFNRNYIFILLLIFTILFIFVPDRFLLNTMRIRLSLIFYIFLVLWISLHQYPKWLHVLAAIFFIWVTIYNKSSYREIFKKMDKFSSEILALNNWIEPNSVVLPIFDSYSWLHRYSMSYLGVDKPIIQLRNTHTIRFFPVIFKDKEDLPLTLLGNKKPNEVGQWFYSGSDTTNKRIIDYVLISNPGKFKKNIKKIQLF